MHNIYCKKVPSDPVQGDSARTRYSRMRNKRKKKRFAEPAAVFVTGQVDAFLF